MKHINQARRHFLQAASGMAATAAHPMSARFSTPFAISLAGLGAMAAQSSSAADTSGPYKALVDAMGGVQGNDTGSHLNRARVAVLLALASPEYMVQR